MGFLVHNCISSCQHSASHMHKHSNIEMRINVLTTHCLLAATPTHETKVKTKEQPGQVLRVYLSDQQMGWERRSLHLCAELLGKNNADFVLYICIFPSPNLDICTTSLESDCFIPFTGEIKIAQRSKGSYLKSHNSVVAESNLETRTQNS